MKTNLHFFKIYVAIFCCCTFTNFNAQTINNEYATKINQVFAGIDKNRIPHHLLVDYAMEFAELSAYNGTLTNNNIVHKGTYTSIYNTLLMSRVKTNVIGLKSPTIFKNNWNSLRQADKIVLSGLYYKYSKIKTNAYPNNLTVSNNKYYDKYTNGLWQNPYEEKQVFAVTSPVLKFKKLSLDIVLPTSLWYTNQTNYVQSIAVDFADGNGYQNISFDIAKHVTYSNAGSYEWKYRLTLSNNQKLYAHSKIIIDGEVVKTNNHTLNRSINEPCTNGFLIDEVEFVGTQSYLGKSNTATLQIDYANNDCTIRNPLIVAEGFDSGLLGIENGFGDNDFQSFRTEAFFTTGNLGIEIRNYDIIYINWDKGKDYLQRNALLLEDIISWVNNVKVGNAQNVVLGQSMGGVIARYALTDMEERNLSHETNLYISHDAPHQGANIPLGILYFARHISDQFVSTPLGDINISPNDGSIVSIEDIQDLINAPGTQQLLKNSGSMSNTMGNQI